MRRGVLIGLAVAAVVVVVAIGVTVTNWYAIGRAVGPTCSATFAGSPVAMSVQGWQSDQLCRQETAAQPRGRVSDGAVEDGDEICRYVIDGDLVVVRDADPSHAGGQAVCAHLRQDYLTSPAG